MIQEMKKAFRMTKYCFQLKTNCFSAILITLGGILFLLVSSKVSTTASSLYLLGAFYLILGPMIIIQLQLILLFSNIVKSSPKARLLEIQMADWGSAIISLAGYSLLAIYTLAMNRFAACAYPPVFLLAAGILTGVLLIYTSTSYKLFLSSTIGLAICVFIIFIGVGIYEAITQLEYISFRLSMPASCLLGYLIILICLGLSALLRRAVYKLPLSKLAGGAKLRKQL